MNVDYKYLFGKFYQYRAYVDTIEFIVSVLFLFLTTSVYKYAQYITISITDYLFTRNSIDPNFNISYIQTVNLFNDYL